MAINDGYTNKLYVQREATLNGSGTGTIYALPGKIRYSYQPVLAGGEGVVDLYRNLTTFPHTELHWRGSFECEYPHGELIRLLLDGFMAIKSTQADTPSPGLTTYTYRPRRLEAIGSITVGLEYKPVNLIYRFGGVVVESITFMFATRQVAKMTVEWKAVNMDPAAASMGGSAVTLAYTALSGIDAQPKLSGSNMTGVMEFTAVLREPKMPVRFGEDKKPTRFGVGQFGFSGELAEYFDAETIAAAVRGRTELRLGIVATVPNTSKSLELDWRRVVFEAGTPDAIGRNDIPYRASFSGMQDTALNVSAEPILKLVI